MTHFGEFPSLYFHFSPIAYDQTLPYEGGKSGSASRKRWEGEEGGSCGKTKKIGGIIVMCIFLCKSAFCPNFLVLKAEKFALFSLPCGRSTFRYQSF